MKIWVVFLIALLFPAFVVQANNSDFSKALSSYGTISYSANFSHRGTTLSIKVFYSGYGDYKPHAFEILADLGIDTIRAYDAGFMEFDVSKSDWATKLNNFLTLCDSHGIKVIFHALGAWKASGSEGFFGINVRDGIATAKTKIDALAGNNSLGYNFLTDGRIPFWIIVNEPFLDVTINGVPVLDWVREVATYMRGKGAKVTIGYGSIHNGDATPSGWVPLITNYVDFLIFHWYGGSYAVGGGYAAVYSALTNRIDSYIAQLGDIPVQNLMIGEIGMQRTEPGATEDIRGEYYRALFQAGIDRGLGGIYPFVLFDVYNTPESWGAVYVDESYFIEVTNQYKAYYSIS